MSEWLTDGLRVTVFYQAPTDPARDLDSRKIWEELTGATPDRSTNDARNLRFEAAGPWGSDVWLVVQRIPGRLDVFLTVIPAETLAEAAVGIRHIGRLDDRRALVEQAGGKLIAMASGVSRIAFGATLLIPVSDRVEGYKRLAPFLPGVTLVPEMHDFAYQVNRQRHEPLPVNGTKQILVNRLQKWHVVVMNHVQVLMQGSGVPFATQAMPIGYACRVELDLSTDGQQVEPLPADRVKPLFLRLVEYAVEIANKGDVQ
jgi:hypothetical protein